MSHQLTEEYWESLGPNGPFLREILHSQSQQLAQLQAANNALEDRAMDAQTDVSDAAAKATLAIAQAILLNMPMTSHPPRGAKAAELETFDGSRDKEEQFVQSVRIAVTMQLDTFSDERMKILYALSFMHGGIAQVWAENVTNVVLSHSSTFTTLAELLAGITRTFGDPDRERTARAQLHTLKMTTGMSADEYMAKFEMLAGRTSFNEAALEDTFIRGLPQSILLKVYSQTSLPSGLDNWKTVICNLDRLHQGFAELRQSIRPNQMQTPQMQTPAAIHMPDTSVPMDIDQSQPRPEMRTCYNCGEPGHLSRTCTKPRKQKIWSATSTETNLKSLVAKAIAMVMDAREVAKNAEQAKEPEKETDFQAGQW